MVFCWFLVVFGWFFWWFVEAFCWFFVGFLWFFVDFFGGLLRLFVGFLLGILWLGEVQKNKEVQVVGCWLLLFFLGGLLVVFFDVKKCFCVFFYGVGACFWGSKHRVLLMVCRGVLFVAVACNVLSHLKANRLLVSSFYIPTYWKCEV